jgi:hypothetical protein
MLKYKKKYRIWTQITCHYVNNNFEFFLLEITSSSHTNLKATGGLHGR